MQDATSGAGNTGDPFRVVNPEGRSPYVLICDHASNNVPARFGPLGLSEYDMQRHIAWDPGAAAVARQIADVLDATLVESTVSRLIVDCNRAADAPDLICAVSETTAIPGNESLSAEDRAQRIAHAWQPFHDALDAVVAARVAEGRETMLVAIHSFTPVYKGIKRPWHIGVLHDDDVQLAAPLIAAFSAESGIVVGDNQPYSPADRVYFTLEKHGRARDLPCVMIEIRNDIISDEAGQARWSGLLSRHLEGTLAGLGGDAVFTHIAGEL
ncbi:N-formylglutamate amidohydrolase [Mesorhizobium sp. NBSH29]|uniref:N-formylglutamate amidohydrolase n=1 Tax=Mesorhizobium sp. NBSH29 TaxID=2654249 RepID=UPI0018968D00|nr:N-formylglutamate amidohydrolase [Mesorhizobium sp. NBSH29]QPC85500.1 N-formylglutamate amidohydrolase [Mesorhizobium sp. NBSH29]